MGSCGPKINSDLDLLFTMGINVKAKKYCCKGQDLMTTDVIVFTIMFAHSYTNNTFITTYHQQFVLKFNNSGIELLP